MARITARFKDSTVWFMFTVLFTVLAITELMQHHFDPKDFDPFWLGWDIAFALSSFGRAMDMRKGEA